MARRLFGDIVIGQSGSLNRKHGGMTSLKNGIVRVRVVPKYTRTLLQGFMRSAFTVAASGWSSLTSDEQRQWNEAVRWNQYTMNDSIAGVQRQPSSGRNLFISANQIANLGMNWGGTPQVELSLPLIVRSDGLTASPPVFTAGPPATLTFAVTGTPTNDTVVIRCTPMLSAGVTKASVGRGTLRVIGTYSANPGNVMADYTAATGAALTSGSRIYYQVLAVTTGGGYQKVLVEGFLYT